MADVAPLWPLRYDASLLEQVVAPPHDVVDDDMRRKLGEKHPHNVVHVDMPASSADDKYERAQGLFAEWQEMGVVVRDECPAYWRYAQTFLPSGGGAPITRYGFLALVRAVPFTERVVLPHELTLDGPRIDRMRLSRATRAALSPPVMLYADVERTIDTCLEGGEIFADFRTSDGTRHQLWRITSAERIAAITEAMVDRTLVIADGHERYEAAVAISDEFEAEAVERGVVTSHKSEHRFTVALLVNEADPGLVVLPIHRVVHSVPNFDWSELLTQARVLFDVIPVVGSADELRVRLARETRPAMVAMIPDGTAALFVLRVDADLAGHPVLGKRPAVLRDTAVALLHDGLLDYALGITPAAQASKTHLWYVEEPAVGVAMLERGEGQVLFLMNGTPVPTVRRVADAGHVMPRKSTYFYPKVPTGLCFHTLFPDRLIP